MCVQPWAAVNRRHFSELQGGLWTHWGNLPRGQCFIQSKYNGGRTCLRRINCCCISDWETMLEHGSIVLFYCLASLAIAQSSDYFGPFQLFVSITLYYQVMIKFFLNWWGIVMIDKTHLSICVRVGQCGKYMGIKGCSFSMCGGNLWLRKIFTSTTVQLNQRKYLCWNKWALALFYGEDWQRWKVDNRYHILLKTLKEWDTKQTTIWTRWCKQVLKNFSAKLFVFKFSFFFFFNIPVHLN